MDVQDDAMIASAIEQAVAEFGGIDILARGRDRAWAAGSRQRIWAKPTGEPPLTRALLVCMGR